MKRQGWILLVPVALALLAGCMSWTDRHETPGISKWDYKENCGGCHALPKPKSKTDEEWQAFMMDHRFLSGHDEETAQLFADYLKNHN
jgi:hypothetical protein